jgi:Protein of unknown function (DUF4239)
MSSIAISAGVFALVLGGALLGTFLGARLPKHHLSAENKDVVRLAMAMVGTLTGMALGLLIGSAKTYYDTQSNELTQMSANVTLLGDVLERYGPEAKGVHETLRSAVGQVLAKNWTNERVENRELSPKSDHIREVYDQLRVLAPRDEEHRMMQSEAVGLLRNLAELRGLFIAQSGTTILEPLLFVLIFWMTSIFASWGLFSRANPLSVTTFFVAALCVSGAIFLILEMYTPYEGLLHLSSTPLRIAYDSLAR